MSASRIPRSSRLVAAATLAIERNATLFDGAAGLTGLTLEIKLDADGHPIKAVAYPCYEVRLVTKPLERFTFETT